MGNYNPDAPHLLGQQWVPIREEAIALSPAVNAMEVGHGFTLATSRVLQDARFYINDYPAGTAAGQTFMAAVYPAGTEDLTGPIHRVVIPCSSGGVTGTSGPTGLSGTTSFADAVMDPSDDKYVQSYIGGASAATVEAYFGVNQFIPQLAGKRILGVNLLYAASGFVSLYLEQSASDDLTAAIETNAGFAAAVTYGLLRNGTLPVDDFAATAGLISKNVYRMAMGEIDPFWDTSLSPYGTPNRMPYTLAGLQRFEASNANRHAIRFRSSGSTTAYETDWFYFALEVFYCEEQRVALGGRAFGSNTGQPSRYQPYILNTNIIPLRTTAGVINPVLAAGAYTLVLSSADVGLEFGAVGPVRDTVYPEIESVRQLYALPAHPGVQVNLPFPIDESIVDLTFTKEETQILPHLSLHASGGPLTEVHVYGRQAPAPVYGAITATQEVLDSAAGGARTWEQVRFYARRFGDTTVPLSLTSGGSSVSITPTEHDALVDIIDGWKEVTLSFTVPPTMGAGTNPQWIWSAVGEIAGNQWQVLGAWAPAISGTPGNPNTLVPSPNQLGTATYGQPSAGTTINFGWLTQTPPASAILDDPSADAVLIFSDNLPAVSGFGITQLTQAVSGIGQNCGLDPCCIPNGIFYHHLTWSPTSFNYVPASGFGYYELQRMDELTDWATIMKHPSVSGSSFNDFEARVGIQSDYRIRAVDAYEFASPWSSTVSITMTAPGLTGGTCISQGHVLIFTSNTAQSGAYNLGYSSVWEGRVEENFTFPEAADVQFQKMYGRDFVTQFHPLERGGEQFSRTVLVQAAAISPPTLGDFRGLRDMAWASLPYVCVRDEDGNRWFASVLVPSGRVLRNRQLYLAPVTIIEVTDTPAPVAP